MSYRIAGSDVHKKDAGRSFIQRGSRSEYQFERRQFGSNPARMERCGEPVCATMAIDGSSNAVTSNSYSDGVPVDTAAGARAELRIELA